jgi:hypothetical protein
MATDNITLPGNAKDIRADNVDGVYYQGVKLFDGTADSVIAIPGSADGLAVDIRNAIDLTVIDFAHQEIHDGDSFYYDDLLADLDLTPTQDYILTVPDTAKNPHFTYEIDGLYGITLECFKNSDRVGTTIQTTHNRDHNSATVSGMTIHKNHSAGSTDGTRFIWRQFGSGTSTGKLQANARDTSEIIFKRNTKVLFRLTSLAANNIVAVRFNWYEHTA